MVRDLHEAYEDLHILVRQGMLPPTHAPGEPPAQALVDAEAFCRMHGIRFKSCVVRCMAIALDGFAAQTVKQLGAEGLGS